MIEGCKNFPSPDMIERIAAVLGKDTLDLFSLTPIQHDWKELILSDIGLLVEKKLNEIKNSSTGRNKMLEKKNSIHS
jgi:hypothetical protein